MTLSQFFYEVLLEVGPFAFLFLLMAAAMWCER